MATLNPTTVWTTEDSDIDKQILKQVFALHDVQMAQREGLDAFDFEDFYLGLKPDIEQILQQYKPISARPSRSRANV